jgi:hypothetical protein
MVFVMVNVLILATGVAVESCVGLAVGGIAGAVAAKMGYSKKKGWLLGLMGSGATLIRLQGNNQLSLGYKIGVTAASVYWTAIASSKPSKQQPVPVENDGIQKQISSWKRGCVCGATAATIASFVSPVFGLCVGTVVSHVTACYEPNV